MAPSFHGGDDSGGVLPPNLSTGAGAQCMAQGSREFVLFGKHQKETPHLAPKTVQIEEGFELFRCELSQLMRKKCRTQICAKSAARNAAQGEGSFVSGVATPPRAAGGCEALLCLQAPCFVHELWRVNSKQLATAE